MGDYMIGGRTNYRCPAENAQDCDNLVYGVATIVLINTRGERTKSGEVVHTIRGYD